MKFNKHQSEVMSKAIEVWGPRQQIIKAIEEMAELTVVLTKWLNVEVKGQSFVNGEKSLRGMIHDELADVAIMHTQLLKIFGSERFPELVEIKIQKLQRYLSASES